MRTRLPPLNGRSSMSPAGWSFVRRRSEVARAFALQMLGRTDEAITWLNALYAEDTLVGVPRLTSSLYALARIYVNLLQLKDAEIIARRLLAHGSDSTKLLQQHGGIFTLDCCATSRTIF